MILWTGPLIVVGTDVMVLPRVNPSLVSKRLPLAGSVVILYVSGSPSISAPINVIVTFVSSVALTVWGIASRSSTIGATFTVTVVSSESAVPSFALKPKFP